MEGMVKVFSCWHTGQSELVYRKLTSYFGDRIFALTDNEDETAVWVMENSLSKEEWEKVLWWLSGFRAGREAIALMM